MTKLIFTKENILEAFKKKYFNRTENDLYIDGFDDYCRIIEKANFEFINHSLNFIAYYEICNNNIIHFIEPNTEVKYDNAKNELNVVVRFRIFSLADHNLIYTIYTNISAIIETETAEIVI